MKVYGLTGAPGCGKSTVLKEFSNLGCHTLDADALCASLHNSPGGLFHAKLSERWGKKVLNPDGTTDRKEVAKIVFSDPEELKWLENELYPAITELAKKHFCSLPEDTVSVFEVPLLFERKWNIGLSGTIAVWCTPEIQMHRLVERGWSRKEALERCNAQFPAEKKMELADFCIINNGSLETVREQCNILIREVFSAG